MMTAYFIFKEDTESLTNCYSKFNKNFYDLREAFWEVTGEELKVGDNEVGNSRRTLEMSLAEDLKR